VIFVANLFWAYGASEHALDPVIMAVNRSLTTRGAVEVDPL